MSEASYPTVYDIPKHVEYVIRTIKKDSKPSTPLESQVVIQAHMNCHYQLTSKFGMVSTMSNDDYEHYVLIKDLTAMFIHYVFGTKWIKSHTEYIDACKKYGIDLYQLLKHSKILHEKYGDANNNTPTIIVVNSNVSDDVNLNDNTNSNDNTNPNDNIEMMDVDISHNTNTLDPNAQSDKKK